MSPQLLILAWERDALLCVTILVLVAGPKEIFMIKDRQSAKETKLLPFISTMGYSSAVGKKIMRINKWSLDVLCVCVCLSRVSLDEETTNK